MYVCMYVCMYVSMYVDSFFIKIVLLIINNNSIFSVFWAIMVLDLYRNISGSRLFKRV